MIIKTYIVKSLEEAEAQITNDLGPQAVILTSRKIRPKGLKSWFTAQEFEVTAAVQEEDWKTFKQLQEIPSGPVDYSFSPSLAPSSESTLWPDPTPLPSTYRDPRFSRKSLSSEPENRPRGESLEDPSVSIADERVPFSPFNPLAESREILTLTERLLSRFSSGPPSDNEEETEEVKWRQWIRDELAHSDHHKSFPKLFEEEKIPSTQTGHFLISKGISRQIAVAIERSLAERFGNIELSHPNADRTSWLNALKKELASYIQVAGPITFSPAVPSVAVLVGPTGIGKTTTVLKLAKYYQTEVNKRVLILSIDLHPLGTEEQMEKLATQQQMSFLCIHSPFQLQQALSSYKEFDLILIDTPGRNPYDTQQIEELADFTSVIEQPHQIFLTMSATTKDADVYGIIHEFSRLHIDSLIFTKLDETIVHGILVNTCIYTEKALSYLTIGPFISGTVQIADPEEIARSFLMHYNTSEFNYLRELALI